MADKSVINLALRGVGEPQRYLEPDEEPYWLPEGTFYALLDEVAGRPDVRLSFDDGNASDLTLVLPALVRRGLTARFFPVVGWLGQRGCLDPDGLRALADQGMTIGNHGMHHLSWRAASDEVLFEDLVEARVVLESIIGRPVDEASCPQGHYDRRVLSRLRQLGYRRVFNGDRRTARADAWLQPRYSVRHREALEWLRSSVLAPRPWYQRLGSHVALPTRYRI